MRLKRLWLGFLLVGASPMLQGQNTTTDLSGQWQLNIEKSTSAKEPFRPVVLTITCIRNRIQMIYTFKGKQGKEQYTADGNERVVGLTSDIEKKVKAYWRDGVLIIETSRRANPNNPGTCGALLNGDTEYWTLSPDGQTLKHEKNKSKRVAIYDKVQSATRTAPQVPD